MEPPDPLEAPEGERPTVADVVAGIEVDLEQARPSPPPRDPILALVESLDAQGRSRRTVTAYVAVAQRFIDFITERGTPFAKVTAADAQAFQATYSREWRKKHPTEDSAPAATLATYRAALVALYQSSGLTVEAVGIPKVKLQAKMPRVPNKRDVLDMLAEASGNPRERAVITVLAYAGLRVSELLSLTREDLLIESGAIQVRGGKGQKDRLVPLTNPDLVFDALTAYLISGQRNGSDRIFNFGVDVVERMVKSIIARVNERRTPGDLIPTWVSPHKFRHRWSRSLSDSGVNLVAIQRALGHSSLATTERYVGLTDVEVRKKIQGVGGNLYDEPKNNPGPSS